MEHKKHTSLKDIAGILGVSIPTISRALKDSPEISRELCAKAKKLAKEMNYRPNPFAMSLRRNAPRIIGVIVPDIVTHFFSSILSGIEDTAVANGYFVIITTSHESYEHEKRSIENLVNMRVEGIIACLSQETTDYHHFTSLSDINMPVVLFDRVCLPELFSTVVADGVCSAQKATQHLLDNGSGRVAFIGGANHLDIVKRRKYGDFGVKQKLGGRDLVREFVDACRKNDMKIGLYFSPPDWRYDAVYRNWDHSKKKILDVRHQPLKELPKKPEGHDEKRRELAANQVRELLTEYGKIDIMWFDGGRGEISNDEVRRLQPGIIINKRNGNGGDFGNTEGRLPKKRFVGWFETNDPCWPSSWWGYSASNRMDTGAEVIEKLVTLRAWGGNFLANVGPKADGSIPEEALEAWKEIGKWMKHSGESVYDVTGGPYPEKANQPVTIKGENVMYVHAFPNCQHDIIVKEVLRKPMRALLLRTGEDVPFSFENQTLTVKIPAMQRTRMVDTVKLILDDM